MDRNVLNLTRQLLCSKMGGNLDTVIKRSSVFIFVAEKIQVFFTNLPFKYRKVSMNIEHSREMVITSNENFDKKPRFCTEFQPYRFRL